MNIRLIKRQIGDAVRNQIDLAGRDFEDLLQHARGVLAHDDKALGACGDLVHNNPLVEIRLAKDSMQSCDYRHAKMLQQLQDVISGFAAENSKLMLQADQIDVAGVQVFGGSSVGREVAFADLKSNPNAMPPSASTPPASGLRNPTSNGPKWRFFLLTSCWNYITIHFQSEQCRRQGAGGERTL